MRGNESWVTYASDDREGIKALLLGRSLRRALTTRAMTIFIRHDVSEQIWEQLEYEFDRCVKVTRQQLDRFPGMSFSTVAKIQCWKLNKLDKFAFLDCNSMMLRNSDEIFGQDGFINITNDKTGEITTSLIVDCPSSNTFECLVSSKDSSYLDKLTGMKGLNERYNVPVDIGASNFCRNIPETNIIYFHGRHPIDILPTLNGKKYGAMESAVFSFWLELLSSVTVNKHCLETISAILKMKPEGIERIYSTKITQNPSTSFEHLEPLKNSIAVVGMSLRFPGSNNLDEFWDLIINGRDGIIKVPEGRWNDDQCFNRPENTKDTHAGFLKCPIDQIDSKFFGLSPVEVSYMDPQQRLTLQVMWEAFEHAGINPIGLKNSQTGVFGGWWRNDYKEMLQESGLQESEFFRSYMGNALGTLTGKISHVLELTGPSVSTESGCSTSIVAVDMACKSLQNEDCDLALAFGVNLLIHPFGIHALSNIVAMDGHCKTFDVKADGFGRAEGCAVLVLKRFPDAVKDGDRIWGLVRGSAVVQEGPSRSLGTPTKQCEALAMKLALKDAGVKAKDVSFVETHGTGTPVGDPLEVAAVAEVYSEGREGKLIIGSVKTNIGHTESCSGIAGIIKTILSLQNEMIPPHRNFDTLNPEINLEAIPAEIPLNSVIWQKNSNGQPRIAGVSSFGITGTDAHVIIQETPELPKPALSAESRLPSNIFKLSAKSPEALDELLNSYKCLIKDTEEDINNICFTANIGRGDFQYRSAVLGANRSEILQTLEKKSYEVKQIPMQIPKICFLFTGQGSQYPGMAKSLYDGSQTFKICFDDCASILKKDLGICIKEALWGKQTEDLNRTIYSQTSIFCVEYCLLKLWQSWGVKPDFVLGHSLGEFAAAVAAGILSFNDALTLVAERSRLIDNLPQGKMVVLKESQEKVKDLLKTAFGGTNRWLDFAAINSPEQTVLAGSEENVTQFVKFCENNQVKVLILQATHAFHSRLMDPMLEEYRQVASIVKYKNPTCTYVSGMEGKIIDAGQVDAEYWVRHTREPVRFTDASKAVLEDGSTMFLEVGPQPVLSTMIMINSDTVSLTSPITCLPSIRKNQDEWATMLSTVGKLYINGMDIDWKNFHQFSGGKKVTLPFYPFQNKSQWFDMKKDRQKSIHPLVGTPIPNPSQIKLFENFLDLNSTLFLRDHVIGNTIIFPGAGFLEMCMVSGHAAYQDLDGGYMAPLAPMTLEDFVIDGPLALNENEKTQIQVVVSSEDGDETRVTIYSKLNLDKETHKWIRHASAKFSPYAVKCEVEDVKDTLENIKLRCPTPDPKFNTETVYKKLQTAGLKFGNTFQTLKAAWTETNECYLKISGIDFKTDKYICHPTMIDAMFQVICIASNPEADQLQVPIAITKFVWYTKVDTEICYVHAYEDKRSGIAERIAVLYDSQGQRIAIMIGATLFETTVNAILSTVEAQRTSLPSLYEEVWRNQLGHLEKRNPEFSDYGQIFSSEFKDSVKPYNSVVGDKLIYYEKSNRLCLFYMLNALYKLGWTPHVGSTIVLNDFLTSLKILSKFQGLIRYFLSEFVAEGYLISSLNRFDVIKDLPTMADVTNGIDLLCKEIDPQIYTEIACLHPTASHLSEILSGKQSALPILFPDDETKLSPAETFYGTSELNTINFVCMDKVEVALLESSKDLKDSSKTVLRVLEVGAGTGTLTKQFLPNAENYVNHENMDMEYTYTDISPVFFAKGEKVFQNSKIKVLYKTLNIEEDPLGQGFIPQNYDIIFASFVVHATQNVRKSLGNLQRLLRPGGCIVMMELTKPLRIVNLIFGVLEGFWKFTDHNIRPYNCEMGADKWETVLKEQNFDNIISFDTYLGHSSVICATASKSSCETVVPYPSQELTKTWLIFSNEDSYSDVFIQKLNGMGRNVVVVKQCEQEIKKLSPTLWHIRSSEASDMQTMLADVSPKDKKNLEGVIYLWGLNGQEQKHNLICQPYLSLCQILINFEQTKVLVVTRGIVSLGDHEMDLPFASPLWGMTKALKNENENIHCKCVDLDPTVSINEGLEELYAEMFNDDYEMDITYRGHQRNICRLTSLKLHNTSISFPKSERFRLVLPSSNAISDLRFGIADKLVLGKTEVEVQVKAYALNFRDVFVVLKPDSMFDNFNTVGIDYAGVITAVGKDVESHQIGDRVFGINLHGDSLPSHIKAPEDQLLPLFKNMTFCDAATLPAVAATAYLSLLAVANLQKNETILIHTGSGGVGLCAIQLAKSLNCNIITTAGSARKRAYLRNLGIKHVFHSRNTDYQKHIRNALEGKGVDVVLNSITGPGFKEASLSVCNSGARFIEMSKLNTWTKEEVSSLRPDVFYEIVDLSAASEPKIKEYMEQIKRLLETSLIKPIPYVRFDASDIRGALDYMQKARHIGKVVCVMPESNNQSGGVGLKTFMFNTRSTYLVTGGLGGIGMEIAKWMTDSGAKNLVLVGRKAPNEKVSQEIRKFITKGVNTVVLNYDVGDFDQCKKMLEDLKSPEYDLPPLRGIMHSAGVLSDASYENQTWEKYEATFNPKINGGWNLHKLTLDYSLEHFVMFSSAVANFGSLGQSNHSAANTFLDSLTHYRNSIGLPGTTVNWGQWSHVGVAANLDVVGLKPITPFQGISALEKIMRSQLLQTCVLEANFGVIRQAFPSRRKYIEELKEGNAENIELVQISSEDFWREYEEVEDNEKHEVVNKFIRSVIRQVLKLDDNDVIDDNANLQDIGMDSLMMIEMKNVLQSLVGNRAKITANAVKDCITISQLGNRMVELISGVEQTAPLTKEELSQLMKDDAILADEIQSPCQVICGPDEIRTVLVTGVTGNLGPYILRELCKRPKIKKIHCLMRNSKSGSLKDRLSNILRNKNLLSDINMDLVECVSGNVIQDKLGLSQEKYTELAKEVDGIFHLAVKSTWQELYGKSRHADNDIRTVNVIGTKHMLEFSSALKAKHFYHAAGALSVSTLDESGMLSEDWPHSDDFDNLPNDAYPISKFICDQLMAQAVERGLPCKVFRFPFIGGDSKNGSNISILNNSLMLRMMAYMHLGIMPAYPVPLVIVPVDVCADISMRIFFDKAAGYEIYNVCNPDVNDEQEFEDFADELGHPVEIVDPDEFLETVEKQPDSELLIFVKKLATNTETTRERMEENIPKPLQAWMTKQGNVFFSKKLQKLIPDYPQCMETSLNVLKRDLRFAKESGVFAKVGLT